MSEINKPAGTGDDYGGHDSSNTGWNPETPGIDAVSDRRNTIGSYARSPQSKWIGIALALATVVYILAELVGIATGNKDRFKHLQDSTNTVLPEVGRNLDQLDSTVQDLRTQVAGIPTELPTLPPIIVKPGQQGQPGQSTTTVIMPSPAPTRTVLVTPVPTPKPTPTPTPSILNFILPPKR